MAIVLSTYAPGAIATYSDLLDEIRDLMDDDNYDQAVIDRALRKAEAEFNRSLRAAEMEKRAMLTVAGELTALPADFLELRFIFQEGSPDTPLRSMSPAGMLAIHAGVSGVPQAYAIEGREIRVGPVGNATLELVYYAAVPALSDATQSNWLLSRHPDLYVSGALFHLARRERDAEGAAQAGQEVMALMQSINRSTQAARWGAAPLIPAGVQQVRGARA